MWRASACEQYEANRIRGFVVLDITHHRPHKTGETARALLNNRDGLLNGGTFKRSYFSRLQGDVREVSFVRDAAEEAD